MRRRLGEAGEREAIADVADAQGIPRENRLDPRVVPGPPEAAVFGIMHADHLHPGRDAERRRQEHELTGVQVGVSMVDFAPGFDVEFRL